MSKEPSHITIRKGITDDLDFIYATWLRAYRYGSDFVSRIPEDAYYKGHHRVIEEILNKSHTLIAHPTDDATLIVGYIVYRPEVAHFIYVKKPFRQMGIARELFKSADLNHHSIVSHWTKTIGPIMDKYKTLNYNPYVLREP